MIDFTIKKDDKKHEIKISTDNAKLAHKIHKLLQEYTEPVTMDISSYFSSEVKPLSISKRVEIGGEEIELHITGLRDVDEKNKESYADIEGVYPAD